MSVLITNMKEKPKDCTECPMRDEYDDCVLQPFHFHSWEEQYGKCPLQEVKDE